jgi:ADP-ribosylglycohydrolase
VHPFPASNQQTYVPFSSPLDPPRMSSVASRAGSALLGCVTADAATLGLHWVYAKPAIQKAVEASGGDPLFQPMAAAWHTHARPGDVSPYGAGALVAADSLSAKGGNWSLPHFRDSWHKTFGPCGTFVGYCDKTTRGTVRAFLNAQAEEEKHLYPSPAVDPRVRGAVFPVLTRLVEDSTGEELSAKVEAVARGAWADADEASLGWAKGAAAAYDRLLRTRSIGADDDQSNALGKLVPVAAAYAGRDDFASVVEASIRATQDNEEAVAWFLPVARMIESAVLGTAATAAEALAAGLPHFSPERAHAVRRAIAMGVASEGSEEDPFDVVAKLGASCAGANTVPCIAYLLSRHGGRPAFAQAVRENALAGGENCARACIIGAILAAMGDGVPAELLAKVNPGARERAVAAAGKLVALPPPSSA